MREGAIKVMEKPCDFNDYASRFPPEVRERLDQMRAAIKAAAPDAEEQISYAMPAFKLNGPLVYFAAFAKHIGFYATPTGHEEFKEDLAKYRSGKGSVQFPHDEPLPLQLIRRIVKFRAAENKARVASKTNRPQRA